jgi:molybdopterin-guanine dinucleotide biosynthesis protein A
MGRDKAMLAHPAGGTFANYAIERLTGLCDQVCLAGQPRSHPSVERILTEPTTLAASLEGDDHERKRPEASGDGSQQRASSSAHGRVLAVIEDPVAYRGPAAGIAGALSLACDNDYEACLVTPVDMPMLRTEDLAHLRHAWMRESKLCCAVVKRTQQLQPLVAIYPVSLREAIQQLADSDDRSLSRWIKNQRFTPVSLSAEACRNINTPEDLSSGPEIQV